MLITWAIHQQATEAAALPQWGELNKTWLIKTTLVFSVQDYKKYNNNKKKAHYKIQVKYNQFYNI